MVGRDSIDRPTTPHGRMPGMSKVRLDRTGAVGEIVIAAPPLNLFDATVVADMKQALTDARIAAEAGDLRAVLLRADGRVFCGGVDVHEFRGKDEQEGGRFLGDLLGLTLGFEAIPVPTVAVVHGINLTIGFEISLGCDLLWAADNARFGLVEATVGLTPGAGGTQRLVARAGVARAAEMVMTGEIFPAADMLAWGVVNQVRPAATLLDDARAAATALAAGPTVATAIGKRLLRTARDQGVAAADAITVAETSAIFSTRDFPAGIESLITQGPRKAHFEGR